MKLRHLFLAVLCFGLLSGCQKAPEQQLLIMPDVTVAVAPFSQPMQTFELLSGFIPEGQQKISDARLTELDDLFRAKLHTDRLNYVMLSRADVSSAMVRDDRGRRSALATWAARAKKAGADMIIVPHVISLREREGGEAGVVSPAAVNEDFYLIDAREPVTLLRRSHFEEEQKDLASDLTKIGAFFRRGGKWISADQLAAEGMDKAVEEFGL